MLSWSELLARRSRSGDAARYWGRLRSTKSHRTGTQWISLSAGPVRVRALRRLPVPYSITQGHLGRPSVTEQHDSHAASCLASQSGAQATSPMEGMVSTTSRLGGRPGGPRTDRYGHAQYEFSYRVRTRNKSDLRGHDRCGPRTHIRLLARRVTRRFRPLGIIPAELTPARHTNTH